MSENAYLVSGLRSPMGRFGGTLTPLRATEVASTVAAVLLYRLDVKPAAVERVIGGMVLQDMTAFAPKDDEIDVALNGVRIGYKPGIVTSSITVLPGRTSVTEFVVLPAVDCAPYGWDWGDLNFDGNVNLPDFHIFSQQWME